MTGETTVRDRATEADLAKLAAVLSSAPGADEVAVPAEAVRRTLVEVQVLRALAGAPTADVAETPCECCGGNRLTVCAACGKHSCWAGLLMCDESRTAGTKQLAAPLLDALATAVRDYYGRLRLDMDRVLLVEVLEEHGIEIDQLAAPAVEPEGMDVEAQGEMAAKLTAAQAAIQRVRDVHRHLPAPWGGEGECAHCIDVYGDHVTWPCPTVRALDGDTTEEQR